MIYLDSVSLAHRTGGTWRLGRPAPTINDVDLFIPQGGFRWLVGPSGAGKSSLLRLMHMELRPLTGRMEILGHDPARTRRHRLAHLRRRIGMVHQDLHLIPELTVLENVTLPLRIRQLKAADAEREGRAALAWLGLSGRERIMPGRLSGGERQRVAIARALVIRPEILLADEPTNALQEGQGRRLIQLFRNLSRQGTTVVVATHNEMLLRDYPAPAIVVGNGLVYETDYAT